MRITISKNALKDKTGLLKKRFFDNDEEFI